MPNLNQLVDKKNYSVNCFLNSVVPRSKLKNLPVVLAERLNSKGETNAHGNPFFFQAISNQLYYANRIQSNVAKEILLMLKEWEVSETELEVFERKFLK